MLKKILSLIILMCLVCFVLSACTQKKPGIEDETSAASSGSEIQSGSESSEESQSGNSSAVQSDTPAPQKMVLDVKIISQLPEYPTGCESVSTVMALNFMGENISVADFVDKYLPQGDELKYEGEKRVGPNPYELFVGSPRSNNSFGCMAPVIEKALNNYFGNAKRIVNLTGKSLEYICKNYVNKGIPVVTWATMDMKPTVQKVSWYMPNGEIMKWRSNEHCLLLVGYDENSYWFNDPYYGKLRKFEKSLVETRYAEYDKQALAILPR